MPQFNGAGGSQNWQQQRMQQALGQKRQNFQTKQTNAAATKQAEAQAAAQADALRTQQARQRQADEEANLQRMYAMNPYSQNHDSPGA
jgi:hypothetical protein